MLRRHDPLPLKLPTTVYVSWLGLILVIAWLVLTIAKDLR